VSEAIITATLDAAIAALKLEQQASAALELKLRALRWREEELRQLVADWRARGGLEALACAQQLHGLLVPVTSFQIASEGQP
jgi:hypothetical protein